jgi:arylsulfatase A-like enzyme
LSSLGLMAGLLVVLLRAARNSGLRISAARAAVYPLIGALALATFFSLRGVREPEYEGTAGKPNLVLIGIDSLRTDMVGAGKEPGLTPHIDAFVRNEAQLFTDAITPLARTFPAWTSILAGRYPSATGARENLVARSSLLPFDSLADILRANGYHTVFATDEVRFSNIDASFGFDQAITPTVGAADFLLGKANDLPLANLIANTWLGKQMFPATYGNRAARITYQPDTFVHWLDSDFQPRGPTMLAVHLTLPHHPFTWAAEDMAFRGASESAYVYSNAVVAADEQFGKIMRMLERKGVLRDALVILLSDHGEALGLPESDALIRGNDVRELLDGQRISLWGHGSSVLSPHQFSAFLALRGFGEVDLPRAHHEFVSPVSLVDLAPTALDLLGVRSAATFAGSSLRPVIAGDAQATAAFTARARFTETGFRTPRIADGDFDERSVLGDAAAFFRMNPANGRFELRAELMPELLADKERAALSGEWLLASLPNRGDKLTQKYLLVSRRGGSARRLEAAPGPEDTEAYALWQALHEHYAGELLPPAPRAARAPAN